MMIGKSEIVFSRRRTTLSLGRTQGILERGDRLSKHKEKMCLSKDDDRHDAFKDVERSDRIAKA